MQNDLYKNYWTVKGDKHSNFHSFCIFKRENGKFLDQGHQGLKISCFSCVIQPIEIVYKSLNNGPTFTKLDSFVAKYFCYENQLRYGPFLNIQTF